MAVMGQPGGKRRPIVENIGFAIPGLVERTLEYIAVTPELQHGMLSLHKGKAIAARQLLTFVSVCATGHICTHIELRVCLKPGTRNKKPAGWRVLNMQQPSTHPAVLNNKTVYGEGICVFHGRAGELHCP